MVISFILLGILYILIAVFVLKRLNFNYLNPHSYYMMICLFFYIIIPLIQLIFLEINYDLKGVIYMNFMLAVSFISYSFGFLVIKRRAISLINSIIKHFDVKRIPNIIFKLHIILTSIICFCSFYLLTIKSGFGFISWLSNPRSGYQYYRTGLGHYYVLSLACLVIIFILYLFFFKPKTKNSLFLITSLFVFISFFYGAKSIILNFIMEALVYYNFFVKKIKFHQLMLTCICSLLFLFTKMSLYSSFGQFSFVDYFSYFDHYNNGHLFFRDFGEAFDYVYGVEYLSGLWKYIPRALYPDKPYSYGIVKYVTEYYYPGAAASGHTPAFGGPVSAYLNFGIFGVIITGFIKGYVTSLFYCYFLKYKNFISFIVLSSLMGFTILPIVGGIMGILWYLLHFILIIFNYSFIKMSISHV